MKKGKITMTISLGCVAFVLCMIMFIQFKTVDQTDITAIETMRETELRTELSELKEKCEEIDEKIAEVDSKISDYNEEAAGNVENSKLLEKEVFDAEEYLGYTALEGEGIEVKLYNEEDSYGVYYSDILSFVNELNAAGAEAISINDERIVNTSEVTLVGGKFILVNSVRISSPYTIKAIGDKKYLESAITIKGGLIDELEARGDIVEYVLKDNVQIPAFKGNLSLDYAKINKEEEK